MVPVLGESGEGLVTEPAVESLVVSVVMLHQLPPAGQSPLTQPALQLTLVSAERECKYNSWERKNGINVFLGASNEKLIKSL